MHLRLLLIALLVVLVHLSTAHGQTDPALVTLNAELKALKKFTSELQAAAKDNPAGGVRLVRQVSKKLRGIETNGLPQELRSALNSMVAAFARMEDGFAGLPEIATEFGPYVTKRAEEDASFIPKLQAAGEAFKTEAADAKRQLDAARKKYGIEDKESEE